MIIEEPRFRQIVDQALADLARQIDEIDTDDLDWKKMEGVLSVEFEAGGVFVLSQQVPVRELWLSAMSRAWHFSWADGRWSERDSHEALETVLTGLFTRKLGVDIAIRAPGPASA